MRFNKLNNKDMSKIMTVDILSSIKGAQPSEAVNKLFDVIKNAHTNNNYKKHKSKE